MKNTDEIVFPLGRWFWTATSHENSLVYVDFNHLFGAVGRERPFACEGMPRYSEKICDPDSREGIDEVRIQVETMARKKTKCLSTFIQPVT